MDAADPHPVTRDELYRLVWETPLQKLAGSFRISDVALAKICRKLNVPLPVRGNWAKVAAGQSQRVRPLPLTAKEQSATIRPTVKTKTSDESAKPQPRPDTMAQIGQLDVPATLENPHKLTLQTQRYFRELERRIKRHAARRPGAPWLPTDDYPPYNDHGRYACQGQDGYRLTCSFDVLERALLILDTIVKALARNGFTFAYKEEDRRHDHSRARLSGLVATKAGEELHFWLRQGYSRRVRTAKELAQAAREKRYVTKHEYLPNGTFTLEFSGTEYGIGHTYKDGKSEKLEQQLAQITAEIVEAVSDQKERRAKRETAEKARREAEHRHWAEQERMRQEREKLEKLLDEAQRASKFNVLRDYLDHIERAALRSGGVTESGKSWLAEARRLLKLYDPVEARLGRRSDDEDDEGACDDGENDEPPLS